MLVVHSEPVAPADGERPLAKVRAVVTVVTGPGGRVCRTRDYLAPRDRSPPTFTAADPRTPRPLAVRRPPDREWAATAG